MLPRVIDAYRVLPELVWCGFGVLAMLMQPFVRSRHFFTFLALIGTLAGTGAAVTSAMHAGPGFDGLVQSDSFSFFFRLLVGTVGFLVVLAAGPYLERERLPAAEFYALLLFAAAGMGVLASAQELLTAFIGLEMSSISSYVLAGYRRDALKSSESAMKYFLLGSFATAVFLYGIALVYVPSGIAMAGKLGPLVQSNVKRLLAYSSSAHAGCILVAFAAVTSMAQGEGGAAKAAPAYAAVLFYLLSYALMKLGAFTIVSQLGGTGEKNLSLDDYAGLSERQPFVAAALSVYLLSLLGLPVTAGFFGKFYIFKAAVNSHLLWLAVLMAVNSVIGAYYYLRVIVVMYMRESSAEAKSAAPVGFPLTVNFVLAFTVVGTLYFGLFPNRVLNFILQPALFGR